MKEQCYEVIVAGAGPQGVAAALAAADGGARTLLLDESMDVGGALGPGLLGEWRGEAESALLEPLRHLSRRAWGRHILEPEDFARLARTLLERAGVQMLPGSRPVKAKAKGDRIRELIAATPAGRVKLTAWCFVDATDDWSLARACGCAPKGDGLRLTLRARIGGIDTRTPGVFDPRALMEFADRLELGQASEEYPADMAFPWLTPCPRGGTALLDANREGLPVGPAEASWAEALGRCRQNALAAIAFLQRYVPGYENCYLIHFAARPQLLGADEPRRRRSPGSAFASQAAEDLQVLCWQGADGRDRDVSLGHLLCRGAENLILARAEGMEPLDGPALLACGQAAGTLASLAVLYDGHLCRVDPDRLRRALAQTEAQPDWRQQ